MTSELLRKRALSEPEVFEGRLADAGTPEPASNPGSSSGSESVLTNTERAQLEQDIADMKAELARNGEWVNEGRLDGQAANRARLRGVLEREIARLERMLR